MKKYLFIVLLVGVWNCEDEESTNNCYEVKESYWNSKLVFCEDSIANEIKAFADQNWSLQNWYNFTQLIGVEKFSHNGKSITDSMFDGMKNYTGSHYLTIQLSGNIKNLINAEFLTSDSLHLISNYLGSEDIEVVKNNQFYINIALYNQFLGGWNDSNTDWYYEEDIVCDSAQVIIKTPKKHQYLDMLSYCE